MYIVKCACGLVVSYIKTSVSIVADIPCVSLCMCVIFLLFLSLSYCIIQCVFGSTMQLTLSKTGSGGFLNHIYKQKAQLNTLGLLEKWDT